jgi:hypothetical protein
MKIILLVSNIISVIIIFSCTNHSEIEKKIQKKELKNGTNISFFNDQKSIKKIAEYENDTLNGRSITFYKNGTIKSIKNYKKGKPVGDMFLFDSIGKLTESRTYSDWYGDDYHLNTWKIYDSYGNVIDDESHYIKIYNEISKFKLNSKEYLEIEIIKPFFEKIIVLYGSISDKYEVINKNDIDTLMCDDDKCRIPLLTSNIGMKKINFIVLDYKVVNDSIWKSINLFCTYNYDVVN